MGSITGSPKEPIKALWDFPWKTYVLHPRFTASERHAPKGLHERFARKMERTLPGLSDAVDRDSLSGKSQRAWMFSYAICHLVMPCSPSIEALPKD
jgi:hypothetical protein